MKNIMYICLALCSLGAAPAFADDGAIADSEAGAGLGAPAAEEERELCTCRLRTGGTINFYAIKGTCRSLPQSSPEYTRCW